MAVAACGQHTKSHRSSGRSPSKKGGGLNWGRAERLDGSSDGQSVLKRHKMSTNLEWSEPTTSQSEGLEFGLVSDVQSRLSFFCTTVNSSYKCFKPQR